MIVYDERIEYLIGIYLTGNLTNSEQEELNLWLEKDIDNKIFFEDLLKDSNITDEIVLFQDVKTDTAWNKFRNKTYKVKSFKFSRFIRYAAVFILSISLLLFFILQEKDIVEPTIISGLNPGTFKAIIISEDGNMIELDDDSPIEIMLDENYSIVSQNGLLVYSTNTEGIENKVNTLKIPKGGEYKVLLSDGTNVHLNSATELNHPVFFNGNERRVKLSGEAFFEVAKSDIPFIVEVDDLEIQVYGTSFNVNTIKENKIQTVLVSGVVGVRSSENKKEVLLESGQLADYDVNNHNIEVKNIDIKNYVAWKDGMFSFEDDNLEYIMQTLSLWYNFEIFFQSEKLKHLHFSGYLKKYENINEILGAITEVTGVEFTINGENIIVYK